MNVYENDFSDFRDPGDEDAEQMKSLSAELAAGGNDTTVVPAPKLTHVAPMLPTLPPAVQQIVDSVTELRRRGVIS